MGGEEGRKRRGEEGEKEEEGRRGRKYKKKKKERGLSSCHVFISNFLYHSKSLGTIPVGNEAQLVPRHSLWYTPLVYTADSPCGQNCSNDGQLLYQPFLLQ